MFQNAGLRGQKGWVSLGVCWAHERDEHCVYYMAAFEWDPSVPIPALFERLDLAAQTYRVFRLTMNGGPVNAQMQAAAREIWGVRIPEAGWRLAKVPDLEVYSEDFRPDIAGVTVDFLCAGGGVNPSCGKPPAHCSSASAYSQINQRFWDRLATS